MANDRPKSVGHQVLVDRLTEAFNLMRKERYEMQVRKRDKYSTEALDALFCAALLARNTLRTELADADAASLPKSKDINWRGL